MPAKRGWPDFSAPIYEVANRIIDMNDLITSQVGAGPVDGRGRFQWYDTFSGGIEGWTLQSAVVGEVPHLTPDLKYVGSMSIEMSGFAGTVDAAQLIERKLFFDRTTSIGLEASFYIQPRIPLTNNYPPLIGFDLEYETNNVQYWGRWSFSYQTLLHSIETEAGTVTFGATGVPDDHAYWITAKLSLNFTDGLFTRLVFGQNEYDLSEHEILRQPAGFPIPSYDNIIITRIRANHTIASVVDQVNIGHIILTTDEI